jgi:hypothetical protein
MNDDDTKVDHSTMPDPFALAIGLCQIAAHAKTIEPALKKLRKLGRDLEKAEQKLAAVNWPGRRHCRGRASRGENEAAQRRLDAAESAEQDLGERERRIQILEAAWRGLGEPADVMSGFRSPEYSPLQKARMAHGQPPGRDLDPLFSEPDAEPDQRIDAYIGRDVGDERSDAQGNAFAPSTLTRSTSHKATQ